jgi:hypothetical protein
MNDAPLTLAFVGYAPQQLADRAIAFEDAVLPLLDDHGAKLIQRVRRAPGEDPSLPLEVHVIWFPSRRALESYLGDPRRQRLIDTFGEVFTLKHVVEVETISSI